VILTAIADNAVPRDLCAWALDALAKAGKQITGASLTAELHRLRAAHGRPPGTPPPAPDTPRPPQRTCQVPAHNGIQLTPSGICTACAGDARAAAWTSGDHDEPQGPTLGALLLDHGADYYVEISDAQARNQVAVERAYLDRLRDRDAWLRAGYEALREDGYEPRGEAVILVAAELARRAPGNPDTPEGP
jgi:hypothetical protein